MNSNAGKSPFLFARAEGFTALPPAMNYDDVAQVNMLATGQAAANARGLLGTVTSTKVIRETSDDD